MSARWWAFLVWALAAASAAYWGLKLFSSALPVPPQAVLAQPSDGLKGDLARVWGADTPATVTAEVAAPPTDTRFTLVGVLSPRQTSGSKVGVALIAVDGKPAKAYRVGAVVEGQQVLQTVGARSATLGLRGGPALVSLNIPPPAEAARGTPGAADGASAAPPGQPPRPPAGFAATFPGQGQIVTPQIPPQMLPQLGPSPPGGAAGTGAAPFPASPNNAPPQPVIPPLPASGKMPSMVRQPTMPRAAANAPNSPSATQSGEGQR